MACRRQMSSTLAPAACSFSTPITCSSLKRLCFMGLPPRRFKAGRFQLAMARIPGERSKVTMNRTGFPGGPNFWKDGVHGKQEEDEAMPGGVARARGPAGVRAGGGAWLAMVGDPLDRREGGLQR